MVVMLFMLCVLQNNGIHPKGSSIPGTELYHCGVASSIYNWVSHLVVLGGSGMPLAIPHSQMRTVAV